jgi:hypothetical protein
VWFGLHRVHEVGKLDRVLDEEDRHVVADQIPVAFVGVELGGEAAHVANGIVGAARSLDGGKAHEYRRFLVGILKQPGLGVLGGFRVGLEIAMRCRAAGMDDTLGNALVVEMVELLAEDEIFHQRRTTLARLQRIVVVGDPGAVIGAQVVPLGIAAVLFQILRLALLGGLDVRIVGAATVGGRVRIVGHPYLLVRIDGRYFRDIVIRDRQPTGASTVGVRVKTPLTTRSRLRGWQAGIRLPLTCINRCRESGSGDSMPLPGDNRWQERWQRMTGKACWKRRRGGERRRARQGNWKGQLNQG